MIRQALVAALVLAAVPAAASEGGNLAQARKALENIIADNAAFLKRHDRECFEPFLKSQHPRVTLVSCSDSRVQTYALDQTPDDDLFVIRNIGNQIASNEGSVEYGVHHLHTQLLLILGHTGCGAVKAALQKPKDLSPAINREVKTIALPTVAEKDFTDKIWLEGVIKNVNAQVEFARKKFAADIREGHLVVVGALYDLHDNLHKGHGRFTVLNVNGATDAATIAKVSPVADLPLP